MTPRPARPLPGLLTLALVLCLLAPACGGGVDPDAVGKAPPKLTQPITFRVLDDKDKPLNGVRVSVAAWAGQPVRPGPYFTDWAGEVTVQWLPEVTSRPASKHSKDLVVKYRTALEYEVEALGKIKQRSVIQRVGQGRVLQDQAMARLTRGPKLVGVTETVVMRAPGDLLTGELGKMAPTQAPAAASLSFFDAMRPVLPGLGASFAWPGFKMEGSHLTVRLLWNGPTWGAMASAPLTAQATVCAALPMAAAIGADLLPLANVDTVTLELLASVGDPADPHAAPEAKKIILTAPAASFVALGEGRMSGGDFAAAARPTAGAADPAELEPGS